MTRIKPRTLLAVQALAGALACGAAFAQDGPQRLASTQLTAGFHLINAEVASTQEQRAIGLMNRPAMPANDGMLFVFERPGEQCFWMKNTLLPLSIAFIDDDGRIADLADMQPLSEQNHCSSRAVRFALEMNQGWFAKRALKAGTRLKGAPFGGR